jgi:hypothetical protein
MVFTKRLREGVRRGRIRCSVRIWQRLHVKVGGRYPMEDGHIVVDSIATIKRSDVTDALARESGFADADDLLQTATHGSGNKVYLIRFHYLAPGAWDKPASKDTGQENGNTLLQRIRNVKSPASPRGPKKRTGGDDRERHR